MPINVLVGKIPWATMFAVLFTLVTGIVHLGNQENLSFDDWTTTALAVWSFLAIGRGFAKKEDDVELSPFLRLLNTLPWATFMIGIIGIVGYIGVINGSSMTWQELGVKLSIAIGLLGVGRGIGVKRAEDQKAATLLLAGPRTAMEKEEPGVVKLDDPREQRDIHDAGI